jgi:hypothetical protein
MALRLSALRAGRPLPSGRFLVLEAESTPGLQCGLKDDRSIANHSLIRQRAFRSVNQTIDVPLAYPRIYVPVYLCPLVSPFIHLSTYPPTHLRSFYLPTYLPTYSSIHPPSHLRNVPTERIKSAHR